MVEWIEEGMDLVGWCVKSRRGWIPREIWWSGGGGLGGWDISLNFRVGHTYKQKDFRIGAFGPSDLNRTIPDK